MLLLTNKHAKTPAKCVRCLICRVIYVDRGSDNSDTIDLFV